MTTLATPRPTTPRPTTPLPTPDDAGAHALANPLRTTVTDRPGARPRATATSFLGLAYDAYDALAVAEFWAAALRVSVAPGASSDHAELLDGDAAGLPPLVFRRASEGRELRTPLHLRLATQDLEAEVVRLQHLGARRLGALTVDGRRSVTLADPEGNAFDLVAA